MDTVNICRILCASGLRTFGTKNLRSAVLNQKYTEV